MSNYKVFLSDRGIPLVYMGGLTQKPVLTVENYCKWYGFYLVHQDGTVTSVDEDAYHKAMHADPEAVSGDHVYSPRMMRIIADQLGAHLCNQSLEMVVGRWMLEWPMVEDEAAKLHLFSTRRPG